MRTIDAKKNIVPPRKPPPSPLRKTAKKLDLTIPQILQWCDAHFARTGKWPTARSGRIPEAIDQSWCGVALAIARGRRGMPTDSGLSLPRLLQKHRGVRNHKNLPRLSHKQILKWCDSHFRNTGEWPTRNSGAVLDAPSETWHGIDIALHDGLRGLYAGNTLANLLSIHAGVRNRGDLPPLSIDEILQWSDEHCRRTGRWPMRSSGPIPHSRGETWIAVDVALRYGRRGLTGGESLAQFLARHRFARNRMSLPELSIEQVLSWCDAHFERTGDWPTATSGRVRETKGETWGAIDSSLRVGSRGLPKSGSLARFLNRRRGKRICNRPPKLTESRIFKWAKAHYLRSGAWPTSGSGQVVEAPDETWVRLNESLRLGQRGLPGGSSLQKLGADFLAKVADD